MMHKSVDGPVMLQYWVEGNSYFLTKHDRVLMGYGYMDNMQEARRLRDSLNKDWAFNEYTSNQYPKQVKSRIELLGS